MCWIISAAEQAGKKLGHARMIQTAGIRLLASRCPTKSTEVT